MAVFFSLAGTRRFLGLSLVAYGEFMASLGSAAVEDFAAVLGCHARAEAVRVFSFTAVWLIRSFHRSSSLLFMYSRVFRSTRLYFDGG